MAEENSESTRSWSHPPSQSPCNADIRVAGRDQSVPQNIDGAMSLFSVMVKAPRDTTEAAEAALMAAQFVFMMPWELSKSPCLYVLERQRIGSPQEDEHGFNDNAISAYQLRICGTSFCSKDFLAYSPSWVCRDYWGSRRRAMHRMAPGGNNLANNADQSSPSRSQPPNYGMLFTEAKRTRDKDFPMNISCLKSVPPCSAYCQPRHTKSMQSWAPLIITYLCHTTFAEPRHPSSS